VRNVVVDTAASGDSGVIDSFTTSSTLIWVVYYAHFVATGVTNQTVLIKSGSTEVGRFWQQGTIAQAWPKTFENGGHPVWIGRAAGDILQINLSAASQMNAFFLVGEIAA
jgi:hypothetical protein